MQMLAFVIGATFMAAGGSAPELFTSLIGVAAVLDYGMFLLFAYLAEGPCSAARADRSRR